jgi:hypothetical protein
MNGVVYTENIREREFDSVTLVWGRVFDGARSGEIYSAVRG